MKKINELEGNMTGVTSLEVVEQEPESRAEKLNRIKRDNIERDFAVTPFLERLREYKEYLDRKNIVLSNTEWAKWLYEDVVHHRLTEHSFYFIEFDMARFFGASIKNLDKVRDISLKMLDLDRERVFRLRIFMEKKPV